MYHFFTGAKKTLQNHVVYLSGFHARPADASRTDKEIKRTKTQSLPILLCVPALHVFAPLRDIQNKP